MRNPSRGRHVRVRAAPGGLRQDVRRRRVRGRKIRATPSAASARPSRSPPASTSRPSAASTGPSRSPTPRACATTSGATIATGSSKEAEYLLREADVTTSTFSYLLGTSMNKRLLKDYQAWPSEWQKFTNVVAIKDFKQQDRIRLGAFGSLSTVAEDAAYTTLTLADTHATYTAHQTRQPGPDLPRDHHQRRPLRHQADPPEAGRRRRLHPGRVRLRPPRPQRRQHLRRPQPLRRHQPLQHAASPPPTSAPPTRGAALSSAALQAGHHRHAQAAQRRLQAHRPQAALPAGTTRPRVHRHDHPQVGRPARAATTTTSTP